MVRIHLTQNAAVPTFQAVAQLNQAAPVQNTWYTILSTKTNVRVLGIAVQVDTTGETLEVQVTVDGQVIPSTSQACVAATYYALYINHVSYAIPQRWVFDATGGLEKYRLFLLEGKAIKVEVRKTTAAGAGNLKGTVIYQQFQ